MTSRQPIFISAVSKELSSARQLVANTLQFLGYEPVWQDIFGTEQGDLRAMLRKKINGCKGVVQIVGQCYGDEPVSAGVLQAIERRKAGQSGSVAAGTVAGLGSGPRPGWQAR